MTAFVLDASVTMAWCFADECDPYADAALDTLVEQSASVPAVWPLEVANVLLVAERRGRLRPAGAARFLELLSSLPISLESSSTTRTWGVTLALGRQLGLSSYDASYVGLAQQLGAPLATRDRQVRTACAQIGIDLWDR